MNKMLCCCFRVVVVRIMELLVAEIVHRTKEKRIVLYGGDGLCFDVGS